MLNDRKSFALIAFGIGVGLINGFLGGGAGALAVFGLMLVMKQDIKQAHATALLVVLPVTIFSAITYIFTNNFNFSVTLFVTIGVTLGGIVGALLLNKMSNSAVRYIFAVLLVISGLKMLFEW
ncbi:MAG: sulfite exporter TauE/SafE family protein [Clostridia bacterium]